MKTSNKRILESAVISAIIISALVLSFWNSQEINKAIQQLNGHITPTSDAIKDMRNGTLRVLSSTLEIAFVVENGKLASSTDLEDIEAEYALKKAGTDKFIMALAAYGNIETDLITPKEKGLGGEVMRNWNAFNGSAEIFLKAVSNSEDQLEIQKTKADLEDKELAILSTLDTMRKVEIENQDNWRNVVNKVMRRNFEMMSLILLISIAYLLIAVVGRYRAQLAEDAAEKKLDEMGRVWESNFNAMTDLAVLYGVDGRIMSLNHAFSQLLGKKDKELARTDVRDVLNGLGLGTGILDLKAGETRDVLAEKSGIWYSAIASVALDENNKIKNKMIILHDVTEAKKMEEKLEARNRELEIFHDTTVDRELKMIELKKEVRDLRLKTEKSSQESA